MVADAASVRMLHLVPLLTIQKTSSSKVKYTETAKKRAFQLNHAAMTESVPTNSRYKLMSDTHQDNNPYVTPLSNASYEIRPNSRSSKVGICAFIGAIAGIAIQVFVQLIIVAKPITTLDDRYFVVSQSIGVVAIVFWAIVVGTSCAIMGSVVGALLDSFYSAHIDAEVRQEASETDA